MSDLMLYLIIKEEFTKILQLFNNKVVHLDYKQYF